MILWNNTISITVLRHNPDTPKPLCRAAPHPVTPVLVTTEFKWSSQLRDFWQSSYRLIAPNNTYSITFNQNIQDKTNGFILEKENVSI